MQTYYRPRDPKFLIQIYLGQIFIPMVGSLFDIIAAVSYYSSRDYYFCYYTIAIVLLPTISQGFIELTFLFGCLYKSWDTYINIWKTLFGNCIKRIFLQLPFIHTFEKFPSLVDLSKTIEGEVERDFVIFSNNSKSQWETYMKRPALLAMQIYIFLLHTSYHLFYLKSMFLLWMIKSAELYNLQMKKLYAGEYEIY